MIIIIAIGRNAGRFLTNSSEPFSNSDLSEFFGIYLSRVVGNINVLHNVISHTIELNPLY